MVGAGEPHWGCGRRNPGFVKVTSFYRLHYSLSPLPIPNYHQFYSQLVKLLCISSHSHQEV